MLKRGVANSTSAAS